MSGICGFVGTARPGVIEAMLAAIAYRGDRTDTIALDGASLGYRWWEGRPGKSSGIHRDGSHAVAVAGTFAPPDPSPAVALRTRLAPGSGGLATLDGAFAGAWWDATLRRLTLIRDPHPCGVKRPTESG